MNSLLWPSVTWKGCERNFDLYVNSSGHLLELPEDLGQEAAQLIRASPPSSSIMGTYRKRDIVGNGVGALAGNDDGTTDVYNTNRELCATYDNEVRLDNPESVGNLGILTTNTAAGFQTGIFDFHAGEFLLIVDGEVQDTVIRDAYTQETSAFLLEDAGEMHTLVCKNGTMVENVSRPSSLCNSATGYILLISTTEADKIVIINVDTGEIVSEFQAHLIQ